jgi:hypothetical protein
MVTYIENSMKQGQGNQCRTPGVKFWAKTVVFWANRVFFVANTVVFWANTVVF